MNKKILLVLSLLINFAFASIPASVDRSSLTLGQSLTLTIDVSNTRSDPDLDVLRNNFDILGTNSSSQTNIINGAMSSQKNFIVSLSPKNTGRQTIPAIKVGNDTTSPISINVLAQSAQDLAAQRSQIFVDAVVNNPSTYIGVPLVYSLKIYFSVGISNVRISSIDIKGATMQQFDKGIQYSEDIKGKAYQVYEQKLQITPNKSGNITIPSIRVSGLSNDGGMGDFFGRSGSKTFNVASKALNVTVKPIPSQIVPQQWFPAKQVSIEESQSISDTTIKLGQPITRTIVVEALGVPSTSIPEIKLVTPKNVNAYPDKTVSNNSFSGNDILSTKVFKVAYIPTQAGDVEFPEATIKWWDITSDSLKTVVIPGKTYKVLNENGKALDASAVAAQQLAASTEPVIAPVEKTIANGLSKIWFYLAIAFAFLWLITLLIVILLIRKKSIIVKQDNSKAVDKLASEKKALILVRSACHDKNIQMLNSALVQWASLHWQKKIYTVLDIKGLSTNDSLNKLIDEFNQTIYRGSPFDKFNALEHEIDILVNAKQEKINDGLKELYPS